MNIDKEALQTGIPGDIITYTLSYWNTGLCENGNAYNVRIIDTLPENTTFINASVPPVVEGNLLIWDIPQVDAGDSGTITVDVMINPGMPENTYYVRVYEYKKYAAVREDWIGLGGILSYDEYSVVLDETHKYWHDINEVQIHRNSEEIGDVNMALYQRCIFDDIVVEFLDNEGVGEQFKGFFRIYTHVVPGMQLSSEFTQWNEETREWNTDIYAGDTFYLFVFLENGGKGMARGIRYNFEYDIPSKDATWMYLNYCEQNAFDLYPDETGYIILAMEAPPVDFEKKYTTTVHITWKDDLGVSSATEKTFTVNVKPQPQSKVLRVEKHVVGSGEIHVGETRRIQVFIRNWSDEDQDVAFEDNIPEGLSVVEGTPEFAGTIGPQETVEVDYVLRGDAEGSYSFSGEAYYEDVYGSHKVISNLIEIQVIGTEALSLTKEISKNYLSEGEIITVSLTLRNHTEDTITEIMLVDIVPDEFTVTETFTDGAEWEGDILRYTTDTLEPTKAQIVKYAIKAPSQPGRYSMLGARTTYLIRGTKKEKTTDTIEIIVPEADPPSVDVKMDILERIPSENMEILTLQLKLSGTTAPVKNIHLHLDHGGFVVLGAEGRRENGLIYEIDTLDPGEMYITKATFKTGVGDKELSFIIDGSYRDELGLEYFFNEELPVSFVTKKPIVTAIRSLEESTLRFGYSTQLVYTVENTGEGEAVVSLRDEFPEAVGKAYSWEGRLDPGEKHSLRYTLTPERAGTFELSGVSVTYIDRFGNQYTAPSEALTLQVEGLVLVKTVEGSTVALTLTNTYSEKAFAILIEDSIPEGFDIDGTLQFNVDYLDAGESQVFSYDITAFGSAVELPAAQLAWEDIYRDRYTATSNTLTIPYEEEEEKEEEPEEEEEKQTPTSPPPSPKPPEEIEKGFDLKYLFIPITAIGIILALYYLFSRRKEEIYGIPLSEDIWPGEGEGDVWSRVEEAPRRDGKRYVPTYRMKERREITRTEELSKDDIEIQKLWRADMTVNPQRKSQVLSPVAPQKPPEGDEGREEKKFWREYIDSNKAKTLKQDLKNLEMKEKEYKERDDKKMIKEISQLKRIIIDEIRTMEGSYENIS
jgi:uncharacterized repeat protein (TIGR01451 family)